MTQAQANRTIRRWKQCLNLGDWEVRVQFVDAAYMDGALGNCSVVRNRQIATVKLAWPHPSDEDLENTVVHELLHCYFDLDDLREGTYAQVRNEQGVDMVANLLVRMSREHKRTTAPRKPDRRRKLSAKSRRNHP